MILLPGPKLDAAEAVCAKLRAAIEQHRVQFDGRFPVSIAIPASASETLNARKAEVMMYLGAGRMGPQDTFQRVPLTTSDDESWSLTALDQTVVRF